MNIASVPSEPRAVASAFERGNELLCINGQLQTAVRAGLKGSLYHCLFRGPNDYDERRVRPAVLTP
jgi:hypothetical protein